MHRSPSSGRASLLRKLIHLSGTLIPAAGWLLSFWLALAFAGALLAASLALEAARRWWPWVNRLLWRLIPSVFREWENRRVLGSTWCTLGMLATLLLCGRDVGGTAVLFLAWGDPAAELAGRRWGRPGQGKTLTGSLSAGRRGGRLSGWTESVGGPGGRGCCNPRRALVTATRRQSVDAHPVWPGYVARPTGEW